MRIFINHIENAIESLNANRMRTFLTMLGVTIGVASMTIIFSLSGGVNSLISDQVKNEGGAIAVVRPKDTSIKENNIISSIASTRNFNQSSLSEKDIEIISKTQNVVATAPISIFASEVQAEGKKNHSEILATTSDLEKIINLKLHGGQFIAEPSNSNNVVIGYQEAVNIFGTPDVVSRNIKIKGRQFLIIGVLDKQKSSINFSNVDFNNSIIMNFNSAKSLNNNNLQIQQINVEVDSVNNLENAHSAIEKSISENHQGEKDFEVLSGDKISHPSSKMYEIGSLVLVLVSGVSLIVGGIGIMNIMLVNVGERTREIGIRKALGANNRHILMQFLTESVIISGAGGICGYVLGYAFSFGVSAVLPFKPVLSLETFSLIAGISILVGVFFGLYPAFRASRKDPIESLRHYN